MAIGLDEAVANTRISRYEKGVHAVEPNTGSRIAKALDVPLAFFYADNDDMAELVDTYHHLDLADQQQILAMVRQLKQDKVKR